MASLYWKMIREIPRAFWTSAGVTSRVIFIIGLVIALAAVLGFTQNSVDRWPGLTMEQALLVLIVVFFVAIVRLFHVKLSELVFRLHDALTELDALKESNCDMAASARVALQAIESDARKIAAMVPSRSLEISGLEDIMKRLRAVLNQSRLDSLLIELQPVDGVKFHPDGGPSFGVCDVFAKIEAAKIICGWIARERARITPDDIASQFFYEEQEMRNLIVTELLRNPRPPRQVGI